MAKRGRQSAAELAVVQNVTEIVPRPVAPDDLTDEQAAEWDAIVARLPADWFPRETHGLLKQYCRHAVEARRIAQLVDQLCAGEDFDVMAYDKLLQMQEREGRAMSSLATRMRLTQQATFDKERKKGKPVARKPWE